MSNLILTEDQQIARDAFSAFLTDPSETVFILQGYAGTGKSTLTKFLMDTVPNILKTARLLDKSIPDYQIVLTATTNKAAEALSQLTGMEVVTIHSFLNLRVSTDYKTGNTTLIPRRMDPHYNVLLVVDEASYVDRQLLKFIFQLTKDSKILFIGDPAQLTPVKSTSTPVFDLKYPGAKLSRITRQVEGNPIIELSAKFRETVETGSFFSFKPDGQTIQMLDRAAFAQHIQDEFTRPDWRHNDSKILAWTNKTVMAYNQLIHNMVKGDPVLAEGDYAINNHYVSVSSNWNLKTDQTVFITKIYPDYERHGVLGNDFVLDYGPMVFMPKSQAAAKARLKQAREDDDYKVMIDIEERWADLRAAYASTVNKSQGSTYDRVYIDLDDIKKCNQGEQIARMLYVAVSRARFQVFFVGDLV